jgi:hypothetical protein
MPIVILAIWGCVAELELSFTGYVYPLSNSASTWVDLVEGVGIGAVMIWSIHYRQKKVSIKQDGWVENMDEILKMIKSQLQN